MILEHRVRQAIAGEPQVFGKTFMEQAFDPKKGRLRMSLYESEQRGALSVYQGVMDFFRNPTGHQLMQSTYTQHDACCFVLWIDFVLRLMAKADGVRGDCQHSCTQSAVIA